MAMMMTVVTMVKRNARPMFCLKKSESVQAASCDGVAERALGCALQQEEGEEDAEDAVAVVDRVRVDAVDTEDSEGHSKDSGGGPRVVEDAEKDAPGEQGCGGSGECCIENVGIVDATEELDDCGLHEEGEAGAWAKGRSL